MRACVWACVRVCACVHVCACVRACVCMRTYACVHACVRVCCIQSSRTSPTSSLEKWSLVGVKWV